MSQTPIPDEDIDWSLTTFEGARREQRRRIAQASLRQIIQDLEDMEAVAERLTLPHPPATSPRS